MLIKKKHRNFLKKTSRVLFINSILFFCLSIALSAAAPMRTYAAGTVSLPDAVDKGKLDVTAKGDGNYQDISLNMKNRTNSDLKVDINGSYFTPPEGSSSQRLGVSHIKGSDGDSVVELGPKETKDVKATAFCIDASNSVPGYNENFTLGGDVSDIPERPYLDKILDWYKNHPDATQYEVQDAIWSIESDHEGKNYHYNDAAAAILDQVTGSTNPLEDLLKVDEAKDDLVDSSVLALGTSLSSLLASGAISLMNGGKVTDGATQLWDTVTSLLSKNPKNPPSAELVKNLEVDNLTEAVLGQGEDRLKTKIYNKDGTLKELQDNKLSNAYNKLMTGLGIFNDANALFKDGYNDNPIQSVGLATMMNLGANEAMSVLEEMGSNNLGAIETFAKLFLPKSTQDILPSNIVKQSIQAVGDVTKAVSQSLGEGSWEPINKYAQDVADGKKGLMLSGYGQLGQAAGDVVNAIEEKGVVQTIKDFGNDCKEIITTGALKDVVYEGMEKIADEADKSSGADKGIAELSKVAGHVVGTIESKGVVKGTKEMAGQFVDDVKLIVKHGDIDQISKDVGDSAEKATGIIGKGVAEASSLAGEYYEQGGGIVGGAKAFASDCALIWKYLW